MALPDYSNLLQGTSITWKPSGQGGDYDLGFTSLSSTDGREGDKSATLEDGTYGLPVHCQVIIDLVSNASGNEQWPCEFFIGESTSATAATANPGNLSGSDAAWSNAVVLKHHLTPLGVVHFGGGTETQGLVTSFSFAPLFPYVIPAVYLPESSGTLSSTASDHSFTIIPFYSRVVD